MHLGRMTHHLSPIGLSEPTRALRRGRGDTSQTLAEINCGVSAQVTMFSGMLLFVLFFRKVEFFSDVARHFLFSSLCVTTPGLSQRPPRVPSSSAVQKRWVSDYLASITNHGGVATLQVRGIGFLMKRRSTPPPGASFNPQLGLIQL